MSLVSSPERTALSPMNLVSTEESFDCFIAKVFPRRIAFVDQIPTEPAVNHILEKQINCSRDTRILSKYSIPRFNRRREVVFT